MKRVSSLRWLALTSAVAAFADTRTFADDLDTMSRDDKQWIMPEKNYSATRFSG